MPIRHVPPYVPTLSGFTTSGFTGSRFATAGSFPAFTCAASTGDSLYVSVAENPRPTVNRTRKTQTRRRFIDTSSYRNSFKLRSTDETGNLKPCSA